MGGKGREHNGIEVEAELLEHIAIDHERRSRKNYDVLKA